MRRYMESRYCSLLKIKTILRIVFNNVLPCMFIFCVYASEDSTSPHHFTDTLPVTMEEIDFKWCSPDFQDRSNYIKILKPCGYAEKQHLRVGSHTEIRLFNGNIQMRVTAIKKKVLPLAKKINSRPSHGHYLNKYSMVTAIFVHQSPIVKTYKFSNAVTHNITALNATPEHPFYVRELHNFIAVKKIKPWMSLDANGSIAHIVSGTEDYSKSNSAKTTTVYDIETSRHHVYHVGSQKILVHNCNIKSGSNWMDKEAHAEEINNFKTTMLQTAKSQLVDELTTQARHDKNKIRDAIWRYNSLVNQHENLYLRTISENCFERNTHFMILLHKDDNRLIEVVCRDKFDPMAVQESDKGEVYRLLNTSLQEQGVTNMQGEHRKFYPPFKVYYLSNQSSPIPANQALPISSAMILYDQALPIHTQTLKRKISDVLFGPNDVFT